MVKMIKCWIILLVLMMEQGWGGMKTHPPSLLSPSREFKWMGRDAQVPFIPSPTDPQCEQCGTMYGHNATIVNSHCRLPLCRDRQWPTGNGNPTGRLRFRRSCSLPSTFRAAWDLDSDRWRKLRPMKWEMISPNLTVQSRSPLMVMVMVAAVMVVGDASQE